MEELNVDNVKVGLHIKSEESITRHIDKNIFKSGSVFEVVEVIDDYKNANTVFDTLKTFTIRCIDSDEELFMTELMFRCFSIVPKELSYKTLKIGTIVQCNMELHTYINRHVFPEGTKFEVSYIGVYVTDISIAEDGIGVVFTLKQIVDFEGKIYGEEINLTENWYCMLDVLE